MRRIISASLIGLFISAALFSREAPSTVYAPFISHLDARANGTEVVLSWRDSSEKDELLYRIYRYSAAIDSETLKRAELLAVVAPGINLYTDKPDEGVEWWYAISSVGPDEVFELMIPWRNTLGTPVRIDAGASALDGAVRIESLEAEASGMTVHLTYYSEEPDTPVVVFRSPRMMDTDESIDHAVQIGRSSSRTGSFEDRPLPGIPWYYAAVDALLFDSGTPRWREAAAFAGPIRIEAGGGEERTTAIMRPAPLPILRISRSMNSGRSIPDIDGILPVRQPMDNASIRTLAEILEPITGRLWTASEPEILDMDRAPTENRRQMILKNILDETFTDGQWGVAEAELFALAASNGLDKATRARILFYIGQCRYYQDDMKSAFLSFLTASDYYYPESRKWMIRIYDEITPVS